MALAMEDHEHPERQPLWMPKGSVRSILAIGLTGATITAALVGNMDAFQGLGPLAGAVITYYFEHRKNGS